MVQILALYFDFEGVKYIYVLQVLIWGFGGCWRFLTRVRHLVLDFDMVACLLSPDFRLWRMLEVPDWVWNLDLDLDLVTCL